MLYDSSEDNNIQRIKLLSMASICNFITELYSTKSDQVSVYFRTLSSEHVSSAMTFTLQSSNKQLTADLKNRIYRSG